MARIYSDEEKRTHLDQFMVSGKSKTEYARENDIPEATFRAWIKDEALSNFGILDIGNMEASEFLKDAQIPLTNSKCERAIRPFAVHRKNWLFADTVDGAKANAIYYSLVESAKLNNLNIYMYINYLLKELPQLETEQNESNIEQYLPWSKDLPEEILNYQGTYEELNFEQ